jgi:hypothetical protein
MNITGKDLIAAICNKLIAENKDVKLYDTVIIQELRKISWKELNEITQLGKWKENKQESSS